MIVNEIYDVEVVSNYVDFVQLVFRGGEGKEKSVEFHT